MSTFFRFVFLLFSLTSFMATAQPGDGPPAQTHKKITFIASNLRNGGVKAISESFQDAAKNLKWQVDVIDCKGQKSRVQQAFKKIIEKSPDGVVLGGFDGADYRAILKKIHQRGVKVVGWHAAAKSGATDDMFANITTDPVTVAQTAAEQLLHYGAKEGGVIILTDRDYSIATAKTLAMKRAVEAMTNFKVISVEDVPIAQSDKAISHLVKAWNQRFGKSWTHTLAINDLYFDHMAAALKAVNREDVVGIGAGDGSDEAIQRVSEAKAAQLVTIAEPLKTQGWQLADELNRAFAGAALSDFDTKLLIISKKYLENLKTGDIEEHIPYRETYLKIWYPDKN